jgi:SPP1 family predicted phage head-tail adaptor
MNPGQLTQRLTLSRLESGQDEIGQPIEAWVSLGDVWGSVEPQAGREFIAAGAAQSELTTKIRIRWKAGIQSADRVTHDGTIYDIQSVIDYRSQRRELVLMCRG